MCQCICLPACLHGNQGIFAVQNASHIAAPYQLCAILHVEHDRLYCKAHLHFRDAVCMQGC